MYRINGDFTGSGNAYYDPAGGVYDEVYLFRLNGDTTANGTINSAYFSSASGRTRFNDTTATRCFLHDGSAGGLDISAVGAAGDSISFYVNLPLGVASAPVAASPVARLKLYPARPNPSRGAMRLSFELDKPGPARLAVYSVTGQLVAELVNSTIPAGRHEAAWSGHDRSGRPAASGVYFIRLEAGWQRLTQRLTVLR